MKYIYLAIVLALPIISMDAPSAPVRVETATYYYDLGKTVSANDEGEVIFFPQSLFVQLVVQAAKAKNIDTKPFQELLAKIGKGITVESVDYVGMTKKDGQHRLLSYIPTIGSFSWVNGKKVAIKYIPRRGFSVYNPSELFERITFSVDNSFESDTEHHAKIVAEFDALIKKKQP